VLVLGCVACLAAPVHAEEEEPVSLELLEFLGSFETASGKWIDPTQLKLPAPTATTDSEEKKDD
jgi:hypothetical protein